MLRTVNGFPSLLDRTIKESKLPLLVARAIFTRALLRSDGDSDSPSKLDLAKALPYVIEGLHLYYSESELEPIITRLERLLLGPSSD